MPNGRGERFSFWRMRVGKDNFKLPSYLMMSFVVVAAVLLSSAAIAEAASEQRAKGAREQHSSDASGVHNTARSEVLEQIVVTAQKREQSILDVPMSVAVLTGRQLERAGINSLESVAYNTPSLTVLEQGSGLSTYMMRGVGNIAGSSPLVGIYLDEISLAQGGLLGAMDLRIFDLERVEVLKGPQGTLYGEGSVGGTIRLISKDPQFDRAAGNADVAQLTTNGGDSSQVVRGAMNLPINDLLAFRIAATYENIGGWVDIPTESRSNVNGSEIISARIKGLWRPAESFEIRGTAIVHDGENESFPAGVNQDQELTTVFPDMDLSASNDYRIGNLTATYDFGTFDLLSTSSYIEIDSIWRRSQFVRFGPSPAAAVLRGLFGQSKQRMDSFAQELRLGSKRGGPWDWNVGVYYRDQRKDNFTTSGAALGGVLVSQSMNEWEDSSEAWALFSNVAYDLTERFEVGVGLRYFEDRQEQRRPVGSSFVIVNRATFDSVNPRLYLAYDLSQHSMVYLNVAKGFRSGGFNQPQAPLYKPEDLVSYDLGVKGAMLGGALRAELAAFFSTYKDAQTLANVVLEDNRIVNVSANVGEAKIKGFEGSVGWNVAGDLHLEVGGSILNSEVTSLGRSISATHAVGDPLDLVPEYSFRISGSYDLRWSREMPGFIRIDYTQQGQSTSTNRASTIVPPQGESDIIGLLSARLNAQWNQWYFELFAENLLDEDEKTSSWDFIGRSMRPRPRTLGVRVGVDFN